MAVALAAGALWCGCAASAEGQQGISAPTITRLPPRVAIAVLPSDTTVSELAAIPHMSVGVMSAGIGPVSSEQTYLDITQGNRVDDVLYDRPLPQLRSFLFRAPHWRQIVQRADSAPADIVPGLLASTLLSRGISPSAVPAAGSASLVAVDRHGLVRPQLATGVTVFASGIGIVRKQAMRLLGDGLLIALAEPSSSRRAVPIGIAGRGFDGNLTSDSTRTDGYVLSTDIAPTILRRFGLAIPDQMDGEPIRAEGKVDSGAIEDRAARMNVIPDRRAPVVILCLAAWILVAALVAFGRPGLRREAFAWLALAFAYMPLMLLAGAAIEPGAVAEGLLVGIGAAVLALTTLLLVPSWRSLAVACAITVAAYAIDVITGSGLTKLSLLGPNPIFGVRFFGVGNELEALIAVMVPVAVGAGLTAAGEGRLITRPRAIAAFLVSGGLAAVIFAAGRFGADVGAAIVLPVGAAVAAVALPAPIESTVSILGRRVPRRGRGPVAAMAIAVALIVGPAMLALVDLVSGGNAHLTRSVLDAGGAGDLADIAQRRLELSAHDFAQAAGNPLFWVVIVGIVAAASQWRRIDAWLMPAPAARAGVIGACAAVAVGVLVNDSGATFLTLGALALGASLAFAWAQARTDP
jgi:hypothetical protein